MAEVADIVWCIAELIAHAHCQAHVMRDRQQEVELYPVCLRFAADVLIEHQRTIHEGQFMIVDVRQPAELAEEPPGLERQVPRQRGRLDRSLFHRCAWLRR